jgi:hypothetical protein
MTHESPLRPDEDEYRTEVASPDVAPRGDPDDAGAATEGEVARPWIIVGLVLLAVFLGILAYAVVLPLFS